MNINNEVRDSRGCIVGYRCHRCYGIFPFMWGAICNACRSTQP